MTPSDHVGRPSLMADTLEAWRLGDRLRDRATLVGALAMRKLAKWRGVRTGSHVITIRSAGILVSLDVWAAEHRPLREIIARDEYGIIRGKVLRPGGVAVDVGANIGVFSLMAALRVGPTGRVVAFEPHPRAFQRLVRNIEQNHLGETIVPIPAAVSDLPGVISFNPDSVTVHNSVDVAGSTKVPAVTLDDDLHISGVDHIDLLKIDVEGHEVSVLTGAERTLLRTAHVVVEYQTAANRELVVGRLERAGFADFSETRYGVEDGLITATRALP
jgi:FkbM family methyltransferase